MGHNFFQTESLVLNAIGEDWKSTGRCDLAIAKEKFMLQLRSLFLMKKNSQYSDHFKRQYKSYLAASIFPLIDFDLSLII